ncbi:MAG: DUF2076 domain-containing protein [Rhodocyclales bacterium GT-UBC]|nr:MAG: DUF2076 domain-containing protein [Rhodocyclales bacterium GT-UBC]
MNFQEREQLNAFLSQLVAARVGQKDAEAESLIRDALGRQPDAAYLLVQKAFLQEQALRNAQGRIDQLQAELDAARASASRPAFADSNSWGNSAARPAPAPAPAAAAPAAPSAGWGSGWLGNVATTAAGVVAGSFLFQGIEHLMGHQNGGLFGGNNLASLPNETTVINNFFEPDSQSGSDSGFAALSDGLDDSSDPDWM